MKKEIPKIKEFKELQQCVECWEEGYRGIYIKDKFYCECCLEYNNIKYER